MSKIVASKWSRGRAVFVLLWIIAVKIGNRQYLFMMKLEFKWERLCDDTSYYSQYQLLVFLGEDKIAHAFIDRYTLTDRVLEREDMSYRDAFEYSDQSAEVGRAVLEDSYTYIDDIIDEIGMHPSGEVLYLELVAIVPRFRKTDLLSKILKRIWNKFPKAFLMTLKPGPLKFIYQLEDSLMKDVELMGIEWVKSLGLPEIPIQASTEKLKQRWLGYGFIPIKDSEILWSTRW